MLKFENRTVKVDTLHKPAEWNGWPSVEKVSACYKNYLTTGKLDRAIIVDERYNVLDGLVGWMVAKAVGMTHVDVLRVIERQKKPVEPEAPAWTPNLGELCVVMDGSDGFYKTGSFADARDGMVVRVTETGLQAGYVLASPLHDGKDRQLIHPSHLKPLRDIKAGEKVYMKCIKDSPGACSLVSGDWYMWDGQMHYNNMDSGCFNQFTEWAKCNPGICSCFGFAREELA